MQYGARRAGAMGFVRALMIEGSVRRECAAAVRLVLHRDARWLVLPTGHPVDCSRHKLLRRLLLTLATAHRARPGEPCPGPRSSPRAGPTSASCRAPLATGSTWCSAGCAVSDSARGSCTCPTAGCCHLRSTSSSARRPRRDIRGRSRIRIDRSVVGKGRRDCGGLDDYVRSRTAWNACAKLRSLQAPGERVRPGDSAESRMLPASPGRRTVRRFRGSACQPLAGSATPCRSCFHHGLSQTSLTRRGQPGLIVRPAVRDGCFVFLS